MEKHKYTEEEVVEWRKKHGSFLYINSDDANFMVPKPYGYGRSFNWAHPLSWVIGVITIVLLGYVLFFKPRG